MNWLSKSTRSTRWPVSSRYSVRVSFSEYSRAELSVIWGHPMGPRGTPYILHRGYGDTGELEMLSPHRLSPPNGSSAILQNVRKKKKKERGQ